MSEVRHTELPWERCGSLIWRTGENGGAVCQIVDPECKDSRDIKPMSIGSKRFLEAVKNAELILSACNSHEQDQKTIAALVSELQASTNRLNTVIDSGLLCDDMKRSLQKQNRFNETALALAKEKP